MTPEETDTPKELAAVHGAPPLVIDPTAAEPAMRLPQPAPLRMDPQPFSYVGLGSAIGALTQVAPEAPALVVPPDPLRIP
jgi:hypothetical protein